MSVPPRPLPEAIEPLSPVHLRHLDGLRAVLAIFVVMAHCYATLWPPMYGRYPTGRTATLTRWLTFGYVPVEVFIVLSGYCLMLPVARNGGRLRGFASTFYRRRARRILPTFFAALVLNLLLIWGPLGRQTQSHWDICLPVTVTAVVANLLMVQDLFELYKINHTFWSISIEWRLYFLFPIVVWAMRRMGPWVATGLCAAGAIFLAVRMPIDDFWWGLQKTVGFFALFVAGMMAGSRPVWDGRTARVVAVMATVVAVWQQSNWPCWMPLRWGPVSQFGIGLAAAGWMAVWSSPGPSLTRRLLQFTPLPAVGIMAFSLYLMHAPIVQLVWQWVVHPLGWGERRSLCLLLGTAVPASIAVAYLFFLVAERPFLFRRQHVAAEQEMGTPSLERSAPV